MNIKKAIGFLSELKVLLKEGGAIIADADSTGWMIEREPDLKQLGSVIAMLKTMVVADRKYMSPQTFRELGFLRELNRQFLHPLGLALETIGPNDAEIAAGNAFEERFGLVQDYRDDPEGTAFADSMLATDQAREQAQAIEALRVSKEAVRLANLGYAIQPIGTKPAS